MTENQLEFDQKNITPTNMNIGTWLKDYTDEHERLKMTKIPMKITKIFKWLKFFKRQTWTVEYDQNNCFLISVIFNRSCSSL